jgi:hypothetical protein
MWSRNFMNEKAIARVRTQRHPKKKKWQHTVTWIFDNLLQLRPALFYSHHVWQWSPYRNADKMNRTSRSSRQQSSSYSRASGFKYRPWDQLHRSMHFVNFPDKLPGQYVKLSLILYNSFTTRYVILTAVKAKIIVSWDVTPCNFDDDQRFGKHWERETSTVRRSRQHVLPKFWYLHIKIHGVKSRKIVSSALLTNHPIMRHYMKSYWNQL